MIYPSVQELQFAALCLVIPAAIVLGYRRPNGPMIVCGGAAFGAFVVFWLLLGGVSALASDTPAHYLVLILTFYGGILLLLASWTLALSTATHARRWRWVGLLTAAGYLSVAAVFFSISQPDPCIFGAPPERGLMTPFCATSFPLMRLLVIACYLAGPAATVVYGLRPGSPRHGSRTLPEGLSVSSLRAASAPTGEDVD